MRDMLGTFAELGNANVFMAKDGIVFTPAPNGTFLDGITRQRVIALLRGDGVTVVEKTLNYADFTGADEIFSTGNFAQGRADHAHRRPQVAARPGLPARRASSIGISRTNGLETALAPARGCASRSPPA